MVEEDLAPDSVGDGSAQPAQWNRAVGEIPQPRFSFRIRQGHSRRGFECGVCCHRAMRPSPVERGDEQGRQDLQAGLVFEAGTNGRFCSIRLRLSNRSLLTEPGLCRLLRKNILRMIPRPGEEIRRFWNTMNDRQHSYSPRLKGSWLDTYCPSGTGGQTEGRLRRRA